MSLPIFGSQVQVTGSRTIFHPNFSGIGGTSVTQSGQFVLISGSAGAGTVTQNQLDALSGVVTGASGTLNAAIANTGQQVWTAANNNGINLSGGLNSLSGFTTGMSGALAQTILVANSGSAVRVTGSATQSIADFSGFGGTSVFLSGGHVLISGGLDQSMVNAILTGFSGALVAQINAANTGVASVNGISGVIVIAGAGGISIVNNGQTIFVSGHNWATSGDLVSLSGFLDGLYVHRTGNESISGTKTFISTAVFISGLLATANTGFTTWQGEQAGGPSPGSVLIQRDDGSTAGLGILSAGNAASFIYGATAGGKFGSLSGTIHDTTALTMIAYGYDGTASGATQGWRNLGSQSFGTTLGISGGSSPNGYWSLIVNGSGNSERLIWNYDGKLYFNNFTPLSVFPEPYVADPLANLYRNTTATIGTDGNFVVSGNLGVGIPVASAPMYRMAVSGYLAILKALDPAVNLYTGNNFVSGVSGLVSQFYWDGTSTQIGSYIPAPLKLFTNNVTRILIDSTGNVGIGTSSPVHTLDVNGNFGLLSGEYLPLKSVSSDYTVQPTDNRLYCNNTSAITLFLPDTSSVSGFLLNVKLINTGIVTLTGVFGQKLDGSDSYIMLGQYQTRSLHAGKSNWWLW